MTGITIFHRYKMIGRFCGGILTVVATGAIPNDLCVIYESNRRPGRFRMTVLTLSGTCNVIDRQGSGFNKTGTGMADDALPRRACEYPGNMAAFAAYRSVRALERIAGREMIKV